MNSGRYWLTRSAEKDLADIAKYTLETWGEKQLEGGQLTDCITRGYDCDTADKQRCVIRPSKESSLSSSRVWPAGAVSAVP